MGRAYWQRVKELSDQALALPASSRGEFLAKECKGEPALRRDVEQQVAALSRVDDPAQSSPDGPLTVAVRDVFVRLAESPHVRSRDDVVDGDPASGAGAEGTDASGDDFWVGRTVGRYEVRQVLGHGGMGSVYLAIDGELDREVALKILPPEFFSSDLRRARFDREARLLAALQHANIATIYDSGATGETCYIAMEYVAGETLQQLLQRRPQSVREALGICAQVAEGLQAAHEAQVVHRDLKPSNIGVAADGTVKIYDFGLAVSRERGSSAGDGTPPPRTRMGAVLGTPQYMSPEQHRGDPVDRRTDLWAFGCVLYECLTGVRAFDGDSMATVAVQVLERAPDLTLLPEETPATVRELIARCLRRESRLRQQDAGGARLVIEEALTGGDAPAVAPAGTAAATEGGPGASRLTRREVSALAIASLALLALAVGILRGGFSPAGPSSTARDLRLEIPLEGYRASRPYVVIAPDGHSLAFISGDQVAVRDLSEWGSRELPGTEGAEQFCWSPDSRAIAFAKGVELWRVSPDGGSPERIATLPQHLDSTAGGLAWGRDGRIVVTGGNARNPLFAIPASGAGSPKTLLDPVDHAEYADFHTPSLLPDGRGVLLVAHRLARAPDELVVLVRGELRGI